MAKPESFTDMLIAHLPRLRAYALSLARNSGAADDLVQETSFRALRAQRQFTMGTNFTAWISRILRNVFLSSVCKSRRTPAQIDDLPESCFSTPAEQEDIVFGGQVMRAVDNLCPGQRQAIMLVCADGLSYGEAAVATNSSLSTIKSRLWRARQHMERLKAGSIYVGSTTTQVSAAE